MVFMSEERNRPIFNLALTMAFWSLAAVLLVPFGKVMASTPPMPDQTDPAVCPGFTLPPPSQELDQILLAQQSISTAVFQAGAENYLYCNEGTWLLDEDLNETKEIHSDLDSPISGVTYGGDGFLIYPFLVVDLDTLNMNLTQEQLQWVQDHNAIMSLVGGIIETPLGRTGFYGFYAGFDDDAGGRLRLLVPYDTNNAFDFIYSLYFGAGINRWQYNAEITACFQDDLDTYNNIDVPSCKIDFAECGKGVGYVSGGVVAGCLIGFIVIPPVGIGIATSCLLTALIGDVTALGVCAAGYEGCMLKAELKLRAAINKCVAGASGVGG